MVTLEFKNSDGKSSKVVSVTLPEYNFAERFTLDEHNTTNRRLWEHRIAFGALDGHDMVDAMSAFSASIPLIWLVNGCDKMTIKDDSGYVLSVWEGVTITKTVRTYDKIPHYFFEINTLYRNVRNTKG